MWAERSSAHSLYLKGSALYCDVTNLSVPCGRVGEQHAGVEGAREKIVTEKSLNVVRSLFKICNE